MRTYIKEIEFLSKCEDLENLSRKKLSRTEIEDIKNKHNHVPNDYLIYLREIGTGSIRYCSFCITADLFDFDDLGLNDVYTVPDEIKFFGDNFAGFDLSKNNDEVIEFWHDSNFLHHTNKTFREYIREKIGLDEHQENFG